MMQKRFSAISLWLLLCLVSLPAFAVTRYVKPVSSGLGDGSSWANASGDLQAMINASNSLDEIWVSAGTYIPNRRADAINVITVNDRRNAFVLKTGVKIYGGFTGVITETLLSQRNYTANVTILSGDITGTNCYHVVIAAGAASNGLLDGFTVSNGYADINSGNITVNGSVIVASRGAGIYITVSSPSIQNCIITSNSAFNGISVGGAGILCGSTASPVITNCTISNNNTVNGTGSNMSGAGMYLASATATVSNCNFNNNIAAGEGGGLYVGTTVTSGITNCNFTGNSSAVNGGGLCNYSTIAINITGCDFTSNSSPYGAGLYNQTASPVISNCNFLSNTASSGGGGMRNYATASPTVNNCVFSGNTGGTYGGGMYNSSTSAPAVTNCLFSGNTATNGGGIANDITSNAVIVNSTIAANKAITAGGGVYNSFSIPDLKNCIVYGNTAASGYSLNGTSSTITYSNIEGGYFGTGNIDINPAFSSPQLASSAPTTLGDYHLQDCSPAFNLGNNASVPSNITTDLQGNPRIAYSTVDMGPYEVQSSFIFTLIPTAGILYVDKTKAGDGSSWANAVTELADALKAAKYNSTITQIWVAKGTYNPLYDAATLGCSPTNNRDQSFVLVNNVKVYGSFSGGETTLNGRDFITNETILSGDIGIANDNADNAYHVLISAGDIGNAVLDGFSVVKGEGGANSQITVNSLLITRNAGGGIINYSSSPSITNCTISGNSSYSAGGMYNYNSSSSIVNCTISGNSAASAGGGMLNSFSSLALTNCTVSSNSSVSHGGGIYNLSLSTSITNCTISGNNSSNGNGGGMYNFSSSPVITNCAITGNKSLSDGGGIYNNSFSNPVIINTNISANQSLSTGGGIYNNNSVPVIKNCIIWRNIGYPNSIVPTTGSNVTYSIIEDGYAGTGNINTDPMFVSPQLAVFAPTILGNYRLKACSPAINAGNNASLPGGITTDLDGNPRIFNSTVDMGSYEQQYALHDVSGIVFVDSTKNGDGKTWATAVPKLADALKAAKNNSSISQIWVAKGTYYPLYDAASLGCSPTNSRDKSLVLVNNVKVYGGFAGGESDTIGRNFAVNETVLSGDIGVLNDSLDNAFHVLISAGTVGTAILDGFTVTKGNANSNLGSPVVNGYTSARCFGGGMYNLSTSPLVANCSFIKNTAIFSGGGMYNSTSSPLVTNCNFITNNSAGEGAGLSNNNFSSPAVLNCSFLGNSSESSGGGIYNGSSGGSITNCIFSGNIAVTNRGGAICTFNSITLTNCTIAANKAIFGGGIWDFNKLAVLKNCILWDNTASTGNNIYPPSGSATISNNIVQGGYTGTGNININPLFVSPLLASAAPTTLGDYRLQSCSPAINIGNNDSIPLGITTDLDQNPRIKFTTVDLGAYEVQTQDLTQSTWRGYNYNWDSVINWCGGYIPLATTNVTIPTGVTNYPVISSTANSKNLLLANGSSIGLTNSGQININGNYTNNGSIITNNGTWIMAGSTASQTFPGTAATVNAMNNLEIKNASGIAFDKSFSISGTLIPTTGNINVNNNISVTLKSSATATASVAAIQPAASINYTGSGSFIVERFINTGLAIGQHVKTWQFLATPTTGQTIYQSWQESGTAPAGYGTWITGTGTGFDVATSLPSLKYFNQAAVNWTAVTNTGNALVNKLGYMLFVRGDRNVTTSNGNPNNTILRSKGQLFSPTNPAPSVPVAANKYQTFGNPYASRIAFSSVFAASTGINDVFYVWDPKLAGSYNVGGYQTISGIAGYVPTVGTPPTGNPASDYYPAGVPSPYIESGQAVFVKGNDSDGNVNFNENVKATGSRLVNRPVNINDPIARRQFLFTSLYTNTGVIADGNIVAFEKGFGNEINEQDAEKIMNGGENFGLMRNGSILAVEAHEPVKVTDTIFYNMSNLRRQPYQLRFAPVNMGAVNHQPLLIDRFTNIITPLSLTDSSFVDFTVTADAASTAAGRFFIVFKMKGKPKLAKTDINVKNHEGNAKITNDSEQGYKKQGVIIYPNPVIDGNIHLWFNNMPHGMYTVRIFNSIGQLLLSSKIQYTGRKEALMIKGDKTIPAGNYQVDISGKDNNHFSSMITFK